MSFPQLPDEYDRQLIFEFWWKFSVLENALKRGEFLKRRANRKRKGKPPAEADWDKFGNNIGTQFEDLTHKSVNFRSGVDKLTALSPQRQVNDNGQLDWERMKQCDAETRAAYTLRLLRAVRNNLFHGGKFPEDSLFQVGRNRELLSAALSVLDGLCKLDQKVRRCVESLEIAA